MKITNILAIAFLIAIGSAANCQAQIIVATETQNGVYADGMYKSSPPEYVSHFVLLEDQKKLVRTQLVRIKTGDIIADHPEYKILAEEMIGDGSPGHPKQKIFTPVGAPGTAAVEMLQIGETFFNYCKSSIDAMFMAHGTIRKSISSKENIMKLLEQAKRGKR